jgi:predicted house-cleaning NTP pyrophosphatase (Maf/HAM1 superfamily)
MEDNLNNTQINNSIFWRDGNWGECVGGFHVKTSLKQFIDKCKETGLNVVGLKINDDSEIEIIVERDARYKSLYEKDTK